MQGVWFRGWTVDEARARGLDGWVRNRRDGSVEALFAGPPASVADMINACRIGPPSAEVATVEVGERAADPGATGFHQAPTV